MTVRALDENGDIVTSGRHFLTEREEIAQTIKTRLRLYIGEYFRDITVGTPWFDKILDKSTQSNAEAELRRRIVNTNGVIQLTSFSSDFDRTTRKFSISVSVLTEFGIVDLTESGALNG